MKRSPERNVATRLRALLLTLGLVLVGVVGVASPASAATGNILPPFNTGETWSVCQGYDSGTHTGTSEYGLDLVKNTNGSCDGGSAGATVRAPIAGTVYYYQVSYGNLCVNTADGRSYTLTHITSSITSGSVTAGQAVGTVGAAGSYNNNNVAHIHFQMWSAANCYNSSVIPFDAAHSAQICGAPDLTAVGPDDNNNGTWSGASFTGQSCGGTTTRAGIRNGGFNNGTSYWTRTGSANMVAYGVSGAYEGDGYGATNAAAAGDSIRQDVALNSTAGHSYCVSAQVRTDGSGSGAAGSIAVYVLGSTATEGSSKPFSGLTSNWTPVETCVTATSSHTTLRVQIYPTVGAPTLAVDAVDMHESLVNSAGFNGSSSGWAKTGTANFVTYGPSGTYEGSGYGATNASAAGDSLYQNVTRTLTVGATYCVSAMVRSDYTGATSSGTLALWMLGGTSNENSTYRFNNIGNDWTPIKTCVAATVAHTSLRVQFYPDVNAPTIGVDAVALHPTLAVNGGFNIGTSNWSVSGSANFTTYGPTGAYEGSAYAATNASVSNDSIRQDATRTIDAGDMYCVSAMVRSDYTGATSSGSLALWMLGTSATESSVIPFTNIGNNWTPIKTCVTATGDHTSLRVQIYPAPGAPTIGVDAVDMG